MKKAVIAIDGPAGAGKSTIAKIIAKKLNVDYIDTGAMYRALTYKLLSKGVSLDNKEKVLKILNTTTIDFISGSIYLDGKNIDDKIRKPIINKNVSDVAKIKEVREKLVKEQRKIGKNKDIVMDGRDIGSNVFPNTEYKFYVTASINERGRRRYKELKELNPKITLEDVIGELKKRDKVDINREISPLIKAKDAIEIDTTNKTIDEAVQSVISHINRKRGE